MTCLRVKHSINDLAGRLSTLKFLAQYVNGRSARSASPLILAKNRGVLNRPAKSFIKCNKIGMSFNLIITRLSIYF